MEHIFRHRVLIVLTSASGGDFSSEKGQKGEEGGAIDDKKSAMRIFADDTLDEVYFCRV